ncbi:peptide/nickel transport system permease protein [Parafrankia irregularis]|uniref:Peptide/nickel transport system permease protein n=1 Tax=Parafrankia irregularis TaxID=795642 RepID=A0A0S4QXR3_9ACTN|nr:MULTISPECIES: ABC transporter permease [Parafrankia]MBE3201460.1 ABC transporter permease [Parafrankia sp. CH37]CUU60333.1 peptide/nickel transport system permease protein [Parafrankia irregularis]
MAVVDTADRPETPASTATSAVPAPAPTDAASVAAGGGRPGWLRLLISLLPLVLLAVVAVIGPWITPYDPERVAGPSSKGPSGDHWFGTDGSGLDVLSQLLAATRTNVGVATVVVLLATVGGAFLGLLTGMNESSRGPRGVLARIIGRAVDFVQAVPGMLVGLVAVAFYGASLTTLVATLAIVLAPLQARLVRTEVLRVRSDAYVDAARLAGLSELRLTLRHVLPNSCRPALENISVIFAVSIILTASLGFLGAGLPPPHPEWGSMISRGATDAAVGRWWPATFPTIALILTVAIMASSAAKLFGRRR